VDLQSRLTPRLLNYLFIVAIVAYAAVSLVSTTVAATAQRRPQLRMLRLIGANRGQVTRTVTIEAELRRR
jgi:ABC-type lipoprotein release transport system permease subunit